MSKKKKATAVVLEAAQFEQIVHSHFLENDDFKPMMDQFDSMLRFSVASDEFVMLTSDRRDNFVLRAQRLKSFLINLYTEHVMTYEEYDLRRLVD